MIGIELFIAQNAYNYYIRWLEITYVMVNSWIFYTQWYIATLIAPF